MADKPTPSNHEIVDPETQRKFVKESEKWFDFVAAWISGVYLFVTLAFLAWLLFDVWVGQYSLFVRYPDLSRLNVPIFRLMAYTAIGGGLGGAVNGLRSLIRWHAEEKCFGWRFIWKYLALPPLGATLAVIVYALVQGGIAIYSGSFAAEAGAIVPALSALATGALAGYGSHKVFVWLDEQVNKLFSVAKSSTNGEAQQTGVPNLIGLAEAYAKTILEKAELKFVKGPDIAQDDVAKVGLVVDQSPAAGSDIPENKEIVVSIGIANSPQI